jgi:hypothetical protein
MSLLDEVNNAVVHAYYQRMMASSDAARARAQAAYGIASAVAAAVVAAGLFGGLDQSPAVLQLAAVTALVAWLVAAALFLRAVCWSFQIDVPRSRGVDAFVGGVLEAVRVERTTIDRRQQAAQIASAAAGLVTVAVFAAALLTKASGTERPATITLTSAGAASLTAACGRAPAKVTGMVKTASLHARFVEIDLDPGLCGPKGVGIAVPRNAILSLVFRRPAPP